MRIVRRKMKIGMLVATGSLSLAMALSSCGGGFSSACKAAINQGIDLSAQTRQFAVGSGAACADTSSSAALEQVCQELQANTESLSAICGDSYGDALNAALLGEKQY